MSPESLLKHFDQICAAPGSVERFKRLVLDIAIRGKLVPQFSAEGSGWELLQKVRNEKAQLICLRGLREKQEVEFSAPNNRFVIPSSWTWAYINDVALIQGGKRLPTGASFEKHPTQHIYIRVTDMKNGTIVSDDLRYISPDVYRAIEKYTINKEDLYITIAGTIGQVGRVPDFLDGQNLTENAAKLVFRGFDPEFFLLALSCDFLQEQFRDKTKQMAQPKLALKRIAGAMFPLPPLAEQIRIVSKVSELMRLCDELEAAQQRRERRRDRLVAATLHGLNNGEVSTESRGGMSFHETARFYFKHLPRLTTRLEHVQQLRHSILNLAVSGRLVAQSPDDEPTEILRGKIEAERRRLQEAGHIRIRASMGDPSNSPAPYQLPASWAWVYFDTLVLDSESGWSPQCEAFPRTGDNWGVVKVSAVSWNEFDPTENKQLLPGVVPREEVRIQRGDFLISRANTSELVAKCVIVRHQPVNLMMSDKIVRLRLSEQVNPDFVRFVNNHADYARAYYSEEASGTSLSMKNVSRDVIYRLLVPLPPLAEQNRIVAKVQELTRVCDGLETQFKHVANTRRALLEATLQEALGRTEIAKAAGLEA